MAAPEPTADSHCHIDMDAFDEDRAEVLDRAREAGIAELLLVGCINEAAGHRRAIAVAQANGFRASAGVHPHDAKLAGEATYDELTGLSADRAIVAVGEIGLDFHYDNSPRAVQRDVFKRQIHLARDVGLPIIVHTREADAETAEMLEQEGAAEVGGVIHCFTGGHDLADRALALGFFISFSGIVTFPRAKTIAEVARKVPSERLLVETDAPFLAPPPHRGKRNEPAFVTEVVGRVAELRGAPYAQIAAAALENFGRLFESEPTS